MQLHPWRQLILSKLQSISLAPVHLLSRGNACFIFNFASIHYILCAVAPYRKIDVEHVRVANASGHIL